MRYPGRAQSSRGVCQAAEPGPESQEALGGAQRGPASLPACPLAVCISAEGDSSPKGAKRCSQHSGLSTWDSCAVHDYCSSQLMLCLCTAASQRTPKLSSALCIFLCIYSVLLYPRVTLLLVWLPGALRRAGCHQARSSVRLQWLCMPRSSPTSLTQGPPSQYLSY